jgi:hypothetical protein
MQESNRGKAIEGEQSRESNRGRANRGRESQSREGEPIEGKQSRESQSRESNRGRAIEGEQSRESNRGRAIEGGRSRKSDRSKQTIFFLQTTCGKFFELFLSIWTACPDVFRMDNHPVRPLESTRTWIPGGRTGQVAVQVETTWAAIGGHLAWKTPGLLVWCVRVSFFVPIWQYGTKVMFAVCYDTTCSLSLQLGERPEHCQNWFNIWMSGPFSCGFGIASSIWNEN